MKVFDFEIPDSELSENISAVYKCSAIVQACSFEVANNTAPGRLAKVTITVQLNDSIKSLEVLVQECSPHTLAVVSVIEKILPNSCPKIFGYRLFSDHAWLILENVATWLDASGVSRMNETALDGLYEVHAPFLGNVQPLFDHFSIFSEITKSQLNKLIPLMIAKIDKLAVDAPQQVVTALEDWADVKECVMEAVQTPLDFPTTLLHGSFTPNNIRSIQYPNNLSFVIAYDWRYSRIGWPQLDLAVLLDRLDLLAESRQYKGPSAPLLERYWLRLRIDLESTPVSFEQFVATYKFSYMCQALPLIRLWADRLSRDPERDPLRATAEIRLKCNTILDKDVRVFIDK